MKKKKNKVTDDPLKFDLSDDDNDDDESEKGDSDAEEVEAEQDEQYEEVAHVGDL